MGIRLNRRSVLSPLSLPSSSASGRPSSFCSNQTLDSRFTQWESVAESSPTERKSVPRSSTLVSIAISCKGERFDSRRIPLAGSKISMSTIQPRWRLVRSSANADHSRSLDQFRSHQAAPLLSSRSSARLRHHCHHRTWNVPYDPPRGPSQDCRVVQSPMLSIPPREDRPAPRSCSGGPHPRPVTRGDGVLRVVPMEIEPGCHSNAGAA